MRIGMFSWESLYSVKVGGIAPTSPSYQKLWPEEATKYT